MRPGLSLQTSSRSRTEAAPHLGRGGTLPVELSLPRGLTGCPDTENPRMSLPLTSNILQTPASTLKPLGLLSVSFWRHTPDPPTPTAPVSPGGQRLTSDPCLCSSASLSSKGHTTCGLPAPRGHPGIWTGDPHRHTQGQHCQLRHGQLYPAAPVPPQQKRSIPISTPPCASPRIPDTLTGHGKAAIP